VNRKEARTLLKIGGVEKMTLTDQQIAMQLHNTELALYHLAAVLVRSQPPEMQDMINSVMSEYSDAMESCGASQNTAFVSPEGA